MMCKKKNEKKNEKKKKKKKGKLRHKTRRTNNNNKFYFKQTARTLVSERFAVSLQQKLLQQTQTHLDNNVMQFAHFKNMSNKVKIHA